MQDKSRLILVVDDDQDIRETLASVLLSEGYRIRTAGDGATALQDLATTQEVPNLILLDLLMPNMNGDSFLSELMIRRGTSMPPVIGMTAGPKSTSLPGMTACLKKPLELEELLEIVDQNTR